MTDKELIIEMLNSTGQKYEDGGGYAFEKADGKMEGSTYINIQCLDQTICMSFDWETGKLQAVGTN